MSDDTLTTLEAPALIVFGLDDRGKSHASSFNERDAALATKAAGLMGMKLLPVRTDAERALAAKLPKGRVFASGKGFVPFCKATVYAELEAAAPPSAVTPEPMQSEPPQSDMGEPRGAAPVSADAAPSPGQVRGSLVPQPTGWGDIQVGAIVLSAAVPGEMDWFECVVVGVEADEHLVLRYCDWPSEPTFVHHVSDVGLLHPTRTPEPPINPERPSDPA